MRFPTRISAKPRKKIRKLPETHGKSCSETRDLDALIATTDEKEKRNVERAVAEATLSGGSEAKIERARLNNLIPRIRVETILKHTRSLNRPAKMLVKLGHLDASPFTKHMISNKSAEAMRSLKISATVVPGMTGSTSSSRRRCSAGRAMTLATPCSGRSSWRCSAEDAKRKSSSSHPRISKRPAGFITTGCTISPGTASSRTLDTG